MLVKFLALYGSDVNLLREKPAWLNFVDHTGDAGIFVRASDLEEPFARAAWGMFYLITDINAVRPVDVEYVEVEATDLSALMLHWLSELNYRHVTEHRLFGQFEVIQTDEESLVAVVRGEKLDRARHEMFTEIKAVTFHAMRIQCTDRGWEAQIIFDL
jgi:SHS2 domain-containing protein